MYTIEEDAVYAKNLAIKKQKAEVNRIVLAINKTLNKKIMNILSNGYTTCKIFRSRNKFQSHVLYRYRRQILKDINVPSTIAAHFNMRMNIRLFGFGRRYDLYIEI